MHMAKSAFEYFRSGARGDAVAGKPGKEGVNNSIDTRIVS